MTRYRTDDWGAYTRHLYAEVPKLGKRDTSKIERTHLTFRSRRKRLVRKTICLARSLEMHDIIIGYSSLALRSDCLCETRESTSTT
jgi:insertion element IS1 protein InsB